MHWFSTHTGIGINGTEHAAPLSKPAVTSLSWEKQIKNCGIPWSKLVLFQQLADYGINKLRWCAAICQQHEHYPINEDTVYIC